MRIRTIKPGFFANEGLSEVSESAQLLAGGLLCYADDEGYFNANPGLVKAAVFPLRKTITEETVADLLRDLAVIGYCRFGKGKDGKRYGHIINFSEHQKVSHAIPSKIKELGIVWEDSRKPLEDSGSATGALRPELNRTELNRTEKELRKPSASAPPRGLKSQPGQVSDAMAQTRHSRVQQLVMGWYRDWAGVECPWDGGEAKQLSSMLKAWPNQPDQQFVTCLDNLARSDCVAKGTRPREWLSGLPKFVRGPLDRFWKPMGVGNGAGTSKAADRNARNREAIIRGSQGYRGSTTAVPDGPAVQPGDHAGTHGAVAGVPGCAHPKPGP